MNRNDEIMINKMVEAADEYYRTKQARLDSLYMDIAFRVSEMSFAKRRKVGAVIVKDNNILSFGWNGMPSGFNNLCEIDESTNPEVIHAEMNAFAKLARTTGNAAGATLYITDSPCWDCCKIIIQAGIERLVYFKLYRITEPLGFLEKAGIVVDQVTKEELQSQR